AAQAEAVAGALAAAAVVVGHDAESAAVVLDHDPEIFGGRVTDGVGDDLLGAAEEDVGPLRVGDAQALRDFQVHARAGDYADQGLQRAAELHALQRPRVRHD